MLEEEYDKTRRRLPAHLRRVETERPFSFEIRPVQDADIPDIREIYNHYVTNSVVTFDEKKWTLKQWRDKAAYLHKLGMPFLVAQSPSGQVLGYALVQPMSSKSAYRYSVENSIYLGQAATGKGLGRALLEALIAASEQAGIHLTTLDEIDRLDLTVDGADEADANLDLIKGGGGALLREKIVAAASDRMIVIADDSKWVQKLGRFPLPIEVIPFGLAATRRAIEGAFSASGVAGPMAVRQGKDGHPFVTDGGHWIIDARLGQIGDAGALARALAAIPGVVEHGLFIGLASTVILAGAEGIRVVERR